MSCTVFLRRSWRPCVVWLSLGCGLWGGCAWPNLRGPAFKDEPKIGRHADAKKSDSMFGFSTKAQQIERNLGVE
jgi:hypothetical protein